MIIDMLIMGAIWLACMLGGAWGGMPVGYFLAITGAWVLMVVIYTLDHRSNYYD